MEGGARGRGVSKGVPRGVGRGGPAEEGAAPGTNRLPLAPAAIAAGSASPAQSPRTPHARQAALRPAQPEAGANGSVARRRPAGPCEERSGVGRRCEGAAGERGSPSAGEAARSFCA